MTVCFDKSMESATGALQWIDRPIISQGVQVLLSLIQWGIEVIKIGSGNAEKEFCLRWWQANLSLHRSGKAKAFPLFPARSHS